MSDTVAGRPNGLAPSPTKKRAERNISDSTAPSSKKFKVALPADVETSSAPPVPASPTSAAAIVVTAMATATTTTTAVLAAATEQLPAVEMADVTGDRAIESKTHCECDDCFGLPDDIACAIRAALVEPPRAALIHLLQTLLPHELFDAGRVLTPNAAAAAPSAEARSADGRHAGGAQKSVVPALACMGTPIADLVADYALENDGSYEVELRVQGKLRFYYECAPLRVGREPLALAGFLHAWLLRRGVCPLKYTFRKQHCVSDARDDTVKEGAASAAAKWTYVEARAKSAFHRHTDCKGCGAWPTAAFVPSSVVRYATLLTRSAVMQQRVAGAAASYWRVAWHAPPQLAAAMASRTRAEDDRRHRDSDPYDHARDADSALMWRVRWRYQSVCCQARWDGEAVTDAGEYHFACAPAGKYLQIEVAPLASWLTAEVSEQLAGMATY